MYDNRTMVSIVACWGLVVFVTSVSSSNLSMATGQPTVGGFSNHLLSPQLVSLAKELDKCGWDHAILLVERSYSGSLDSIFLRVLNEISKIPVGMYTIGNDNFRWFIHHLYVVGRRTNFVLIADDDHSLLREVSYLFFNHSRGEMAALPHRSNWLLLQEELTPHTDWLPQPCVLDNVASVDMKGGILREIKTLMWRQGRQRQWQSVDTDSLGAQCSMFPNKERGMNGRLLTLILREITFLVKVDKDTFGHPRFSGLYIDVERELCELLNYTTIISSDLQAMQFSTSEEYAQFICNKSGDFGFAHFDQEFARLMGIKVTFPVRFDSVAAAYVYTQVLPDSDDHLGLGTGDTQQLIKWIFIAVVFFAVIYRFTYLSVKYIDIYRENNLVTNEIHPVPKSQALSYESTTIAQDLTPVTPHREDKTATSEQNIDTDRNESVDEQQNDSSSETTAGEQGTNWMVAKAVKLLVGLYRYLGTFQVLDVFVTIFNQSTIERPTHGPLRILIFFWYLFVIVLNSLVFGSLTAGNIKPLNKPPFTSVSDVLTSDQVECGSFIGSNVNGKSKSWIINGEKWSGHFQQFPLHLNSTPIEFRHFMEQPSEKLKVFVHYKQYLDHLKLQTNFHDLLIIDDGFQLTTSGLVTPPDSELAAVLYEGILKLHGNGVIGKVLKHYTSSAKHTHNVSEPEPAEEFTKKGKQLSYYRTLLYVLGLCTSLSFFTLMTELLFNFIARRYRIPTLD